MNTIEILRSCPGYLGVVEAAEYIDHQPRHPVRLDQGWKVPSIPVGNANKIDRLYLADWLEERALTKV